VSRGAQPGVPGGPARCPGVPAALPVPLPAEGSGSPGIAGARSGPELDPGAAPPDPPPLPFLLHFISFLPLRGECWSLISNEGIYGAISAVIVRFPPNIQRLMEREK